MHLVVLSPEKYCVKAQVCLKSETVIKRQEDGTVSVQYENDWQKKKTENIRRKYIKIHFLPKTNHCLDTHGIDHASMQQR